MEDIKVSIVVPVYNVREYLVNCINSLLNQTYRNLQIILVDDGAIDNSGDICDWFAKKDNRISVIHKQNGGLSDARNAGLQIADGEYIAFVDSDDYVHPMYVELLLETCVNNHCLMSKCDASMVDVYSDMEIIRKADVSYNRYSAEEYLELINKVNCGFSAWNKLYSRELFSDISFPKGKIHEDVAVMYKLVDKAKKIVSLDCVLYFCMNNPNSITRTKMKSHRLDDLEFRLEMYKYCRHKRWMIAAKKNADVMLNMIYDFQILKKDDIEDYENFQKRLKKQKQEFLKEVLLKEYSLKECVGIVLKFYVG